MRLEAATSALPPQFDWRSEGKLTAIKDQNTCGSCFIFAAIAAFEASYLISHCHPNDPSNPRDCVTLNISEQEALDCTFLDSDCVLGGWHEEVFLYLQLEGEISGDVYQYRNAKGPCTSNFGSRQYFVLNWGYVRDDGGDYGTLIPSDDALKRAIISTGPIVTGVNTTEDWNVYAKRDQYGNLNPYWETQFPHAVFPGLKPTQPPSPSDINHEVVIVGWNNALGVWIIRNSWGDYWGDDGYMLLPYGCNYIGYGSSWVQAV